MALLPMLPAADLKRPRPPVPVNKYGMYLKGPLEADNFPC